jgi:hypothetical protein
MTKVLETKEFSNCLLIVYYFMFSNMAITYTHTHIYINVCNFNMSAAFRGITFFFQVEDYDVNNGQKVGG